VYWRRRVFVLGVAFAVVFVIARLLTAGSDASSDEPPAAEQAGGRVAAAGDATDAESTGATAGAGSTGSTAPGTPVPPALAEPQGECAAADVVVTPSVAEGAVAGRDVPITLTLQTREAEACTWQVGPDTVVVKVAQGTKDVWTTRQCPQAVPTQPVVVRRAVPTPVQIVWAEARESTEGCTRRAGWAEPGTFTVAAAALGGEPAQADFALGAPAPATVVVTPKAKHTEKAKKPKTPTN